MPTKQKEDDEETKAILARLQGHIEFVSHREEDEYAVDALSGLSPNALPEGVSRESLQSDLKALQKEKDDVLAQLNEAMTFLNSTPVGMDQPLIDRNGFPRADCDLYAVKSARHTVNCSRNDLVRLQDTMHRKLELLHTITKDIAEEQMKEDAPYLQKRHREAEERRQRDIEMQRVSNLVPLVVVGEVEPNSPAFDGGLRKGQLVLQFGDLNRENMKDRGGIAAMGEVVSQHAGIQKGFSVWIRTRGGKGSSAENGDISQLFITPMKWSGRGMLGCGFDAYNVTS